MIKPNILDIYTDYLISSFGSTTATGLSNMLDNEVSHDKITRLLSGKDYRSVERWNRVKKDVRQIESEDGVLIVDDTIQEKTYSQENDLICWHFDHTVNRNVKGIMLLNCVYHANDVSLPVAYELIKKPLRYCDVKTQKEKRKSELTKNELMRNMLNVSRQNQLKWRYVLADRWFSAVDNMRHIHEKLEKYFIFGLKSNRLVALNEDDKKHNRYVRIDSLDWSEKPVQGWVKGMAFPVLFHRQVFTNKDGSTGILYLITNDLEATATIIETTYQKRWKVEVFHKNIKSNTALAKSPTHTVRTQSNHIFMSIFAMTKLEMLSIKRKMNTFALKQKIYLKAIRQAFDELQTVKAMTA